ncbi:MAG: hypothetical protein G01um101419_512 [Parcubacteria group bacterium Gr01-1014_19]|nr:MAG: hypothetical protein G01um101419_512 [Parcubacteria group bacterium Gr01-1014_19]
MISILILAVTASVVLPGIGAVLYCAHRDYKKERRLIEEALKGEELTLKDLLEYQGHLAERADVISLIAGENFIPGNVLKLVDVLKDRKPIYARVPKEVCDLYCRQRVLDVVQLEGDLKRDAQAKREYQEAVERIRRGESPVESSSSASESSSSA